MAVLYDSLCICQGFLTAEVLNLLLFLAEIFHRLTVLESDLHSTSICQTIIYPSHLSVFISSSVFLLPPSLSNIRTPRSLPVLTF